MITTTALWLGYAVMTLGGVAVVGALAALCYVWMDSILRGAFTLHQIVDMVRFCRDRGE